MITKTDIEKYFLAEKQAGLVFIIVAIVAVIIALVGFFILKSNAWKGIAIPLVMIAVLQLVAGYNVYNRSDEQRLSNVYALDMNPGNLVNNELPRMQQVNKRLRVILWIEILLLAAGLVLMILFKSQPAKQLLYGIGIGLTIQSALSLGMDFFAFKRAADYHQQLHTLQKH